MFWADELGQDLTEYTLLLAFVVLSAAALFMLSGDIVKGIWNLALNILSNGSKCATGGG